MQWRTRQQKKEHCSRSSGYFGDATSLSKHRSEREKQECGSHRPGVALDRFATSQGSAHLFLKWQDPFIENDLGRILSIGEVEAARGLCDLGQARHIELGIHRIAVFVADKIIATLIRPDRDQRSGSGTKANRKNPNPGSFRLFGGIKSALLKILSIGHEHQGTCRPLTLAEGGYRHSDRRGNVGSSFGDRIGIQITDRGEDSTFVHRERGLKES